MPDAMMDFDVGRHAARHDPGGKVRLGLQPGVTGGAYFSDCGRYRHAIWRTWSPAWTDAPFALFAGMNPSMAEAEVDDPTVRKEMLFTRAMGLAHYVKVNIMDYRATDPKALLAAGVVPCSDRNLRIIESAAWRADRIILAWGALPKPLRIHADRALTTLRAVVGQRAVMFGGPVVALECMGRTASGAPRHPLYLPNASTPMLWSAP